MRADLPLSPEEAILGGELIVPTPDGEALITVPAGINSGRSLRLKAKGWPLRQGRGDLLLTIQVQIPSELNPEEKRIYEQLRQLRQSLKLNPRDKLVVNGIL